MDVCATWSFQKKERGEGQILGKSINWLLKWT